MNSSDDKNSFGLPNLPINLPSSGGDETVSFFRSTFNISPIVPDLGVSLIQEVKNETNITGSTDAAAARDLMDYINEQKPSFFASIDLKIGHGQASILNRAIPFDNPITGTDHESK